VNFANEKVQKETPFMINYDGELFSISNNAISTSVDSKVVYKIKGSQSDSVLKIKSVKKYNKNWLVLD
jgi:hypothetical protein